MTIKERILEVILGNFWMIPLFTLSISLVYLLIGFYHLGLVDYFLSNPNRTTWFFSFAKFTTQTGILLKVGWLIPFLIFSIIFYLKFKVTADNIDLTKSKKTVVKS